LTDSERAHGRRAVNAAYIEACGGFTCYAVSGGWRNDAGVVVEENGLQYEVVADVPEETAHDTGHKLATVARDAFKQESVLLRVVPVQAEFV
jgi:hypothetical protein